MKNRLLLSLLSLLFLCLAWLGGSGFWLLFALVPLMLVSHSYDNSKKSLRKMYGWAAAVTALWALCTTWWIWYAAPIGTIASVIIHVLLFGSVMTLWHYISKRTKPVVGYLILICGWISAEYWFMQGELSFPWLTLGNGFANDIKVIQWYEYTGVFGGSLWILLCNILIYEAIIRRTTGKIIAAVFAVVIPIAVSLKIYHDYQPSGEQVTVTVVQPNIDPYTEKFNMAQHEQNNIMLSLSRQAPENVDYIIWPETAVDDIIREHAMSASSSVKSFRDFMEENYPDAQLIFGASTYRYYKDGEQSKTARKMGIVWTDIYNSALSLNANGNINIHHKNKLVVGAEKIPYMNLLKPLTGIIVDLGGISGQLGTDDAVILFDNANSRHPEGIRTSTAICYESVYGSYIAKFVRNGSQLIFVITNDGWWHDTPGYKQHFSYSRLRAIEMRRSIARSANTGISGFISPKGDIIASIGWDKRDSITEILTTNNKITFYAIHGDYVARISILLFFMGIIYYIAQRYRFQN